MKKFFVLVKKDREVKECVKRVKEVMNKRGSELAQTVLITGIMVVIIATLFFPQIQSLFTSSMTKLTTWFNNVLDQIGAM